MSLIDPLRGKKISAVSKTAVYPGSHYVTSRDNLARATADIRAELALTLAEYREQNKLLEAQRLEQRTNFDLEMMEEMGYCQGIENYSRHLDRTQARRAAADINGVSAHMMRSLLLMKVTPLCRRYPACTRVIARVKKH